MAGEYHLASRRWRRFLAGEPQFVGGWMELTWCLNMLGEHEDALTAAHKAVELDPEDAITQSLREQADGKLA